MKEENIGAAEYHKLAQYFKRLQKNFDELNQLKFFLSDQLDDVSRSSNKQSQNDSFSDLFPGGLLALNQEAESDLKKVTVLFKKLETQLQQLDVKVRNVC